MNFISFSEIYAREVIDLWTRCGLVRPWNDPLEDLRRAEHQPNASVILGVENLAVVASVMVGVDGHRGWIYYLSVEPTLQRQGLGRAMMQEAERWLAAAGAPKLQLMVRDANVTAAAFYERLGLERQSVTVFGKRLDGRDDAKPD